MLFLVSVIFSSIFLGKCIHQRQEFLLLMFLSFSPPPCLFGGVGVVCIWHLFSHVHTILGKKILKTSKQPRLVDDAIRGIQRKIKWGWRSSGSVLWGLGKIHRDKIRPDPDPELYHSATGRLGAQESFFSNESLCCGVHRNPAWCSWRCDHCQVMWSDWTIRSKKKNLLQIYYNSPISFLPYSLTTTFPHSMIFSALPSIPKEEQH